MEHVPRGVGLDDYDDDYDLPITSPKAQQHFDTKIEVIQPMCASWKGATEGSKAVKAIDANPDQKAADLLASQKTLREKFKAAVGKGGTEDILYAQRLGTVANSLPGMTRGILSAKAAFERGDQIGGSAAIMDICSALAPALGVLAALGPEGAAIGALFSVIGMLLAAFGEKQPSVADQIIDQLKIFDTKNQLIKLDAIQTSLKSRNKHLQGVYLNVAEAMKIEVNTKRRVTVFETIMKAAKFELLTQSFADTISAFADWEVRGWLKEETKQHFPQWPQVLAIWCRSYCDLIASNTMFNCSIDLPTVETKAAYFQQKDIPLFDDKGNAIPEVLSAEEKNTLHGLCTDVLALAKNARDHSEVANELALDILEAITPAAQRWGMMVCLRESDKGLYLITPQQKEWVDQTQDKFEKLAVARAASEISGTDEFNPPCHCFGRKRTSQAYFRINPENHALSDKHNGIAQTLGATDMWTAKLDKGRVDCWVGQAISDKSGGVVRYSWVDGQVKDAKTVFTVPWPIKFVRVASLPGLGQPAIYVGHDATQDIFVRAWDKGWSVRSPWNLYSGIAVDSRHVWVFHPGGFACATHASVLRTVAGGKPQWMEYQLPNRLLARLLNTRGEETPLGVSGRWKVDLDDETESMPPLKGLISFSPCDDGTISASIVFRQARFTSRGQTERPYWAATDKDHKPWTVTFTVDTKAGKLNVGEWTPIEVGGGHVSVREVHKVPIGCWPLLDSLKSKLQYKSV
jgi:hypothetical protein